MVVFMKKDAKWQDRRELERANLLSKTGRPVQQLNCCFPSMFIHSIWPPPPQSSRLSSIFSPCPYEAMLHSLAQDRILRETPGSMAADRSLSEKTVETNR